MIAVDIGNTRAKFGYFPTQSLCSPFPKNESNIKILYNKNNIDNGRKLFEVADRELVAEWLYNKQDKTDWYISVTASCCAVKSFIDELMSIAPDVNFNVLTNADVPIIPNVDFPTRTGIDRLLDAVAAARFVGNNLFNTDSQSQQNDAVAQKQSLPSESVVIDSSCFEIPEAEHASAASRSGSSRAKPIAHTGFGIDNPLDRNRNIETIIVVDAGSAVTVDTVCVNKDLTTFEGGAILPGLRELSVTLNRVSGKLPEIGLAQFQSVDLIYPAKNTESAILTGILGSLVAAINFFVQKTQVSNSGSVDKNLPIIFTGGDAAVIGKLFADEFSDYNLSIVPELTLIGIAISAVPCGGFAL
ncbi:MAG: type III pantothenate kinase [Planctomycetaceae bacterium]|jgi:pantothenate kinase type III|nr:type III pantothenate kinase [Planctomycetaceae bacterium]